MLIGIFGKMGSGKTLLMSILGTYFKYQYPNQGFYCNYKLENGIRISKASELLEIENAIICLDELWVSMDSRSWKNNVFLTRWINQTRKKNVLVMFTTQHMGQIDIRVRRAVDYLIFCEKYKRTFGYLFRYSFISPLGTILKAFKIPELKIRNFYSVYNSYELINSLTGDLYEQTQQAWKRRSY